LTAILLKDALDPFGSLTRKRTWSGRYTGSANNGGTNRCGNHFYRVLWGKDLMQDVDDGWCIEYDKAEWSRQVGWIVRWWCDTRCHKAAMPAKRMLCRAFWRCSCVSHNRKRVTAFINHVDVHIKLGVRSVVLLFNSLRAFVCVPHFLVPAFWEKPKLEYFVQALRPIGTYLPTCNLLHGESLRPYPNEDSKF
jgi:hypothetical protein